MKVEIDDKIFEDLVAEAKEEDLTVEELLEEVLSSYLYDDETEEDKEQ